MLKLINKLTEHGTTAEYFELVKSVFEALNSPAISTQLAMVWLYVQLLQLNGHDIRLDADVNEQPLSAEATYSFSVEDMAFFAHPSGIYLGKHIKVLRLLARQPASAVARVGGAEECMPQLLSLTKQAIDFHLSN